MFEQATRLKLRFNFKGLCSSEDLWDLLLTDLDTIYKELNAELKTQQEESLLVKEQNQELQILKLKIGIVKHVFQVRQREQEEHANESIKAEKKQKLLSIIADKQDETYRDMSIDDLTKLIDEL